MGRNAQPIDLLQANGKKHLTKAEIEQRKNNEIKIGGSKLICPSFIKNDVEAYKKWKEITKIYKDIDFVSSGDVGVLARYCMTFSEYQNLLKIRSTMSVLDLDTDEEVTTAEILAEEYSIRKVNKLINKINYILSTDGLLSIETAINKKMDMLIKMEDRLFLNPLAKVKNVPKATKDDDTPQSKWSKYGG